MNQSDVVTLMRFNSVGEAEIVKTLLESAGITAVLQNAVVASVLPVYGGMLDIRLVVAREDEKKARQILGARFDEQEFEEESQPKRRRKSSADTTKKESGERATASRKNVEKQQEGGKRSNSTGNASRASAKSTASKSGAAARSSKANGAGKTSSRTTKRKEAKE